MSRKADFPARIRAAVARTIGSGKVLDRSDVMIKREIFPDKAHLGHPVRIAVRIAYR